MGNETRTNFFFEKIKNSFKESRNLFLVCYWKNKKNFLGIILTLVMTYILLNTFFISRNFIYHFGAISSNIFPIVRIHLFFLENKFAGSMIFLGIAVILIFLLLVYGLIIYKISNNDFQETNNQKYVFTLLICWLTLIINMNLISLFPNVTGYRISILLFFVTLWFIFARMYRKWTREKFVKQKFLILQLAIIYVFAFLVRIIIVGLAYDLQVDETLYLSMGRLLIEGEMSFHPTHYPMLPYIISLGFAIFPSQSFVSLILISIHSILPIAGYLFIMALYKNKKIALAFSVLLIFSPFYLIYSNRAFMDTIGLILFLLISEALIKKRNPVYLGILGTILLLLKLQYVLQILFFLSVLIWSIFTKKEKRGSLLWIFETLIVLVMFYFPVFYFTKSGLITGEIIDPNTSSISLLTFSTIKTNLLQYFNWAFLRTIYVHSGETGNNRYILFYLGVISLFVISIYAFIKSIKQKSFSPYFLALISIFTLLLPQLLILDKCYQRYSLFLHTFSFLLPLAILSIIIYDMITKAISKISYLNIDVNNPKNIMGRNYFLPILIAFILFLPGIIQFYPVVKAQNENLSINGYRDGSNYIIANYNTHEVILGVHSGWHSMWYFSDYKAINLIHNNGIELFYNYFINNDTKDLQKIIFIPISLLDPIFGINVSNCILFLKFNEMGLYSYNFTI